MTLYEINLQRDILREKSVEVLACIHRYKKESDLEDNIALKIAYKNTLYIYKDIYSDKYSDIQKINEAHGELNLAWKIFKTLNEEDI